MSAETWAVVAVGVALAGLIRPALNGIARDGADLRERMARLEGLIEGWRGLTLPLRSEPWRAIVNRLTGRPRDQGPA